VSRHLCSIHTEASSGCFQVGTRPFHCPTVPLTAHPDDRDVYPANKKSIFMRQRINNTFVYAVKASVSSLSVHTLRSCSSLSVMPAPCRLAAIRDARQRGGLGHATRARAAAGWCAIVACGSGYTQNLPAARRGAASCVSGLGRIVRRGTRSRCRAGPHPVRSRKGGEAWRSIIACGSIYP